MEEIKMMINLIVDSWWKPGGARKSHTSFPEKGYGPDLGRGVWRCWEWADSRGTMWGNSHPTREEAIAARPSFWKVAKMAWKSKGYIARCRKCER